MREKSRRFSTVHKPCTWIKNNFRHWHYSHNEITLMKCECFRGLNQQSVQKYWAQCSPILHWNFQRRSSSNCFKSRLRYGTGQPFQYCKVTYTVHRDSVLTDIYQLCALRCASFTHLSSVLKASVRIEIRNAMNCTQLVYEYINQYASEYLTFLFHILCIPNFNLGPKASCDSAIRQVTICISNVHCEMRKFVVFGFL